MENTPVLVKSVAGGSRSTIVDETIPNRRRPYQIGEGMTKERAAVWPQKERRQAWRKDLTRWQKLLTS